MTDAQDEPRGVMFLQSQEFFGSDSEMHANIIRNLDRSRWDVHIALGARSPSDAPQSAFRRVHEMSDVTIRPTDFGPQRDQGQGLSLWEKLTSATRASADFARLVRYVRRNDIRVIHGTEKPRDAVFATLLSKLTRARSVVHLHVGWDDWISREVQWSLRHADAVIAVSDFVRGTAVGKGGVRAERCHVILNGITADRWDPDTDASAVREEFEIADDDVVLGIFSRMSVWKGHLDLARALGVVAESARNFKVLVVGTDDTRSAPDRRPLSEELGELLDELGLRDNFIMTGWRTDVEQLLAALDVYAMPTFEEPCAVAFLEAMAMAKPIIAIQSGGTPEIVPDEVVGLLAPVGDIDGLAERIQRLMDDAQLRERLGAAGREHVLQRRTAAQMAVDADRIYLAILGEDAPAEPAERHG